MVGCLLEALISFNLTGPNGPEMLLHTLQLKLKTFFLFKFLCEKLDNVEESVLAPINILLNCIIINHISWNQVVFLIF